MLIPKKIVAALLALPAVMSISAGSALADTLYKSIAANGKITYSDRPQPGAISIEPIRTAYDADASVKRSVPVEIYGDRSGSKGSVKLANAALDAAERALALVRQPLLANPRGLLNAAGLPASGVDLDEVDYRKNEVARARLALAKALQTRGVRQYAVAPARPLEATLKNGAAENVKPSLYSFNGLEYPVNSR